MSRGWLLLSARKELQRDAALQMYQPMRSAESHNDNIYSEAAQDSRLNWAVLNLE